MELKENLVGTSIRPLVLIVALLCALAIGLTGFYVLASSGPSTAGPTKPFTFVQDRPGPDSHSRNLPVQIESPNPWDGIGH